MEFLRDTCRDHDLNQTKYKCRYSKGAGDFCLSSCELIPVKIPTSSHDNYEAKPSAVLQVSH